jgi:hypothetical protein
MQQRMEVVTPSPAGVTSLTLSWEEARVAQALGPNQYRLDDGRLARQAVSCLLTPAAGDLVLLLQAPSGLYLSAVLLRPQCDHQPSRAELSVPGAQTLAIHQPGFELNCSQEIALRTLGELELSSAQGAVTVNARHFLATVGETMVQSAQHLVTRVEHCVLQASALLRLHGRQALLTAEDDMKLDAERISLG